MPKGLTINLQNQRVTLKHSEGFSVEHIIKREAKLSRAYTLLMGLYNGVEKKSIEWADELFLSESSCYRLLQKVKSILRKYKLRLTLNPVKILGQEKDIRFFYLHFLENVYDLQELATPEEIQGYHKLIEEINENLDTPLNYDYKRLCYILHISVRRLTGKKVIDLPKDLLENYENKKTYQGFKKLYSNWLEKEYEIKNNNPSEALYNYIAFLDAIIYIGTLYTDFTFIREDRDPKFFEMLGSLFDSKYFSKFLNEEKTAALIFALTSFLYNLYELTQLSPFFQIRSMATKDFLKENHQKIFNYWHERLKSSHLVTTLEFTYLEDIAAVLTMMSIGLVYDDTIEKTNVCFALSGEPGYLIYLTSLLKNALPYSMNTTFNYSNEITENYLKENKTNICISNYPLYLKSKDCTFLNISYIPTESDWALINENLFKSAMKF